MIFRSWTAVQFTGAGFIRVWMNLQNYVKAGIPLYSGSRDEHGNVWMPRWGRALYDGVRSGVSDEQMARLCAAAIRSDDPDAFVEAVLAAYALGGWRAALQLAGAQEPVHEQAFFTD